MARGFFDLPDPLEIRDRGRKIFHADAQQRGDGDAQEFGKLLERLDLNQLATLEPVHSRPRYAKTSRYFVRAQSRSEAERLEPVADVIEPHSHYAAVYPVFRTRATISLGIIGVRDIFAPNGFRASSTADNTAGAMGMTPHSPTPLMPSGLSGVGDS